MIVVENREACIMGGSATVYQARVEGRGAIALKVAAEGRMPEILLDNEWRVLGLLQGASFVPRAYAIKTLIAPGCAGIDGRKAIEMEYICGSTLADLVCSGRIDEGDLVLVSMSLVSAVGIMHSHGIIHRDLHPGNIFITDSGCLMIIDYGAACSSAEAARGKVGTYVINGHEAPETKRERGPLWSPSSDLFTISSVIAWAIRESSSRARLPDTMLARWAARGMEADPSRRFSSCREALGELRSAFPHTPAHLGRKGLLFEKRTSLAEFAKGARAALAQ